MYRIELGNENKITNSSFQKDAVYLDIPSPPHYGAQMIGGWLIQVSWTGLAEGAPDAVGTF